MKKQFLVVCLFALVLFSLPAATVSFLVIETGLPSGSASPESSSLWESALMDAFFDAGHIVSNAPIMRMESGIRDRESGEKFPAEAQSEFDQARMGGSEYFIVAVLEYPDTNYEKPQLVQLRLFRVLDGEFLYETTVTGTRGMPSSDEFLDAKKVAGNLLPQLKAKGKV